MCKKDRRNAIINAAMELIADQGFHGAPMSQIAEKAGVGAGTIYRYFENRDVLIHELYLLADKDVSSFILKEYPEDKSIQDRFFHICRKVIDYYMDRPVEYRYTEQFYNSPYGTEYRKANLMNLSGKFNPLNVLFEEAKTLKIIKDMPLPMYFNLTFGPIICTIRDHHRGILTIDEQIKEIAVSGAWDSIRTQEKI